MGRLVLINNWELISWYFLYYQEHSRKKWLSWLFFSIFRNSWRMRGAVWKYLVKPRMEKTLLCHNKLVEAKMLQILKVDWDFCWKLSNIFLNSTRILQFWGHVLNILKDSIVCLMVCCNILKPCCLGNWISRIKKMGFGMMHEKNHHLSMNFP